MNKCILFCLALLILTVEVEAQWFGSCCRQPCCIRYMDVTVADYDCAPYGYVDNINYPEPYFLPLNYFFRQRCRTRFDRANYDHLMSSIHYTNGRSWAPPCSE